MKDIFIFEGKKYISAKRASEISDYSSDYIGQLCRAGKLDCRTVGRSWFVTEESIRSHMEGGSTVASDEKTLDEKTLDEKTPDERTPDERTLADGLNDFKGKKYISAKRASEISEYSADYIGQLCRAGKLDCRTVGRSWFVTEESIWRHEESISSDEANRGRVANLHGGRNGKGQRVEKPISAEVITAPEVVSSEQVRELVRELVSESESMAVQPSSLYRPTVSRMALRAGIVACVVIMALIGGSFFLTSSSGGSDAQVAESSANVYDAVRSIADFVWGGVGSLLAIFGHGKEVAMNAGQITSGTAVSGASLAHVSTEDESGLPLGGATSQTAEQGVAIVPSSGTLSVDDAAKKKIENTFSDQVDIHPDLSGTTGVITPVFKAAKGKGFIYVMVPVKGASSSP